MSDLIIRADEDKDERDDTARTDEQLKKTINDAIADAMRPAMDAASRCMDAAERCMDRMDRMDARFDSLGGRSDNDDDDDKKEEKDDSSKSDAKKADAKKADTDGEEDEGKGEPEPPSADKKRRDAREVEAPESTTIDARKDEDERERDDGWSRRQGDRERGRDEDDDEREDSRADADMVAMRKQIIDLQTRLGRQEMITPIPMTDEASHSMLEQQARADEVFSQLGERAPPPLVNESLPTYRRRLLRKLSPYSDSLKAIKWEAINDDVALKTLEDKVYADAVFHANNPASVPAGHLLPITERSPTGHMITRYRGDASAWMLPMAGPVTQHVKEFLNT
jgi:hypothetical protein